MPVKPPSNASFVDRAADWGVKFQYENGEQAGRFAILESLAVALGFSITTAMENSIYGASRAESFGRMVSHAGCRRNCFANQADGSRRRDAPLAWLGLVLSAWRRSHRLRPGRVRRCPAHRVRWCAAVAQSGRRDLRRCHRRGGAVSRSQLEFQRRLGGLQPRWPPGSVYHALRELVVEERPALLFSRREARGLFAAGV